MPATTRSAGKPAARRRPGTPAAPVAATRAPAAPPAQDATPTRPKQAAKPAEPAKPAVQSKPAKARKPAKPPKQRVKPVRDSFTMPESDFALIGTLKARALAAGRETKKSELLRAGLQALSMLDTPALVAALGRLEPIKIGRPKKGN